MTTDQNSQLSEIHRQLELQNIPVAEGLCRNLLREYPENSQAWGILGDIAAKVGQLDAAEDFLNRALIIEPGNIDLREKLALVLLQNGKPKQALRHLKQLHEATRQPRITVLLAQTHWQRGSYSIAEKLFHEAVENDPSDPGSAIRAAQAAASLGQFDRANNYLAKFANQPERHPAAAGLMSIYTFDDQDLSASVDALRTAAEPSNAMPEAIQGCAFALELANRDSEANKMRARLIENPHGRAISESFEIKRQHWPRARIFGQPVQVLLDALQSVPAQGLFMEFGVFHGRSINIIARKTKRIVHGFDSFQGLPEDWKQGESRGSYSTEGVIPAVPSNVELHHGWFDKTLPEFLQETEEPAAFVHIDCDIYSSTVTVLDALAPRIRPGTIIVLDDYLGYPDFQQHEFRAFNEFLDQTGLNHEYLSFSLMGREAAVRIT